MSELKQSISSIYVWILYLYNNCLTCQNCEWYISNSIIATAKQIGQREDTACTINCLKYDSSRIIQTRINRKALLRINRLKRVGHRYFS